MKKSKGNGMDRLTIESFGNIMDDFLKENPIAMLIESPEGTIDVKITDNVGAGPVIEFYILMQALEAITRDFKSVIGGDILDMEKFVDGILDIVKKDIMEAWR